MVFLVVDPWLSAVVLLLALTSCGGAVAETHSHRGLMGAPPTQDLMTAAKAVTQLESENLDRNLEKRLRGRKSNGEGGEGRCDAATVEKYLLPSKWQGYRFNDWFANNGRFGESIAEWEKLKCVSMSERTSKCGSAVPVCDCDARMARPFFPDSLFAQYHKRSVETHGGWNNVTLLKTVVAAAIARAPAQTKGPPLNTVVIHVRVGDVIDMASASVAALLDSPHYFYTNDGDRAVLSGLAISQNWNQYVVPLAFFRELIDKGEIQPGDKVVLMAASHEDVALLRRGAKPLPEKSCSYLNRVRDFFVGHGVQTTIRVGHTPDEDIMYAAQSRRFVHSHGGFSGLLGRLVAAFGGDASRPLRPFRTLAGLWDELTSE
jgi:hypothetical protein